MTKSKNTLVRTIVGKVISTKGQNTIVVLTVYKKKHKLYGKYVTRKSKMYAHDSDNICREGDTVRIAMSRPYSKLKCWVLQDVVESSR